MLAVRRKLGSYWVLVGIIITVLLVTYGLAEAFHVPLLTDDISALHSASLLTAFIAIGLLTADTLLPVPSSVVMVANGALFGFWAGSTVSLIGNMLGFLLAYWLGHRASPLIQRVLSPQEMERGNRVLQRWGVLALIVTKPLPILAETTAIMTGVARLSFVKSFAAVGVASVSVSLLYAWAGAHAHGFDAMVVIFLGLVLLAVVAWKFDREMGLRRNYK